LSACGAKPQEQQRYFKVLATRNRRKRRRFRTAVLLDTHPDKRNGGGLKIELEARPKRRMEFGTILRFPVLNSCRQLGVHLPVKRIVICDSESATAFSPALAHV